MLTVGLDVHQAVNLEHGYDFNGNLILLVEHPRTADFEEDYVLDNSDIVAFTAAFQNSDSSADLNGDGIYDQADLNAFTAAFTGGPAGGFYTASFQYDQRNQLVGFTAARGGQPIKSSSYRYDCFNRRVATIIDSSDIDPNTPDGRTAFFVYAGQAEWQLIEEYAAGDDMTADRSYVYGLYIDEVLSMRDQVGDDYYYLPDDLFSVYALTDDAGNVVERYAYGDYGQVSVTAEDGSPRLGSAYGNTHTFTGRLLCDELTLDDGGQLLEYRHRYMMASTGRFTQRDPAGMTDGPNVYQGFLLSPLVYQDPFGLLVTKPVVGMPWWLTPISPTPLDVTVTPLEITPDLLKINFCALKWQRGQELQEVWHLEGEPLKQRLEDDPLYSYYAFMCETIQGRGAGARLVCCAQGLRNGPATRLTKNNVHKVLCPVWFSREMCCSLLGARRRSSWRPCTIGYFPAPDSMCDTINSWTPWRIIIPTRTP